MNIDFHKEISPSMIKVILLSIISYIIVIAAYFYGDDGLFFLVSWLIDPFVFLYVPLLQRDYTKQERNNSVKIHLFLYFMIQIAFGIIILSMMYNGTPYWYCFELYMILIFNHPIDTIQSLPVML
ncbi:MAG: hypothetical protein ACI4Q6_01360, partial [Huintestinicola sp.]